MQDRYAGDVGDFSKFVLLQALSGHDLRPGIVWYRNPVRENNGDGDFTQYRNLRPFGPGIHDKLMAIVGNGTRSVAALESAKIAPPGTIHFSNHIPKPASSLNWRDARLARQQWANDARLAMQSAQLVLLDPDNGMAPASVSQSSKRSLKYAFADEVFQFMGTNQSVVIYQHQWRRPLNLCIAQLRQLAGNSRKSWVLTFHARSCRLYLVLPAPEHEARLLERSRKLINDFGGAKAAFRLASEM